MSIKQTIGNSGKSSDIKYTNVSSVVDSEGTPIELLNYKQVILGDLTPVLTTLSREGFIGTYENPLRGLVSYNVNTYTITHSFGRKVLFILTDENGSEVQVDSLQTNDSLVLLVPENFNVDNYIVILIG